MSRIKRIIKIIILGIVTWLLGAYLINSAGAQNGPRQPGGPGRLDPEEMERSWLLQSDSVAHSLGLDEIRTDQLAEAYLDAREAFQDRMMQARKKDGDRTRVQGARTEVVNQLNTRLSSFLSPEEIKKARKLLGGLSIQVDQGTLLLSDLVDDRDRLLSAVAILMNHAKSRSNPRGVRDRKGPSRQPRGPSRNMNFEALYQDLATVLSPEEVNEFRRSISRLGGKRQRGGESGQFRRPPSHRC